MNAADFRRIALSLEGAEKGSHMGATDFRVGGRIFATLASVKQGYGNLMLTPEQQAEFVGDVLAGALRAAWKNRVEKNAKADRKRKTSGKKPTSRRG